MSTTADEVFAVLTHLPPTQCDAPRGARRRRIRPSDALVDSLAAHVRVLQASSRRRLNALMWEGSSATQVRFVYTICKRFGTPALARYALLFSRFWVHEPASFGFGSATEFLAHLFAKYPVPAFLCSDLCESRRRQFQFEPAAPRPRLEFFSSRWATWVAWYVALGLGGSVRKLGHALGHHVPRRFQECLRHVPPSSRTLPGLVAAEVIRMGGTWEDSDLICCDQRMLRDPVGPPRDGVLCEAAWHQIVLWVSDNRTRLPPEDAERAVEFMADAASHAFPGQFRVNPSARAFLRAVYVMKTERLHITASRCCTEVEVSPRKPKLKCPHFIGLRKPVDAMNALDLDGSDGC